MAFFRVTLYQSFKSRSVQNVFCVEDVVPGGFVAEAIPNIIEAHWIPMFLGAQWNNHTYERIEVQRIRIPSPPAAAIKSINIKGNGSITEALGMLAWKLKFTTGLLGRQHRGRYFVGGLAAGFIVNSTESMHPNAITFFQNVSGLIGSRFLGDGASTGLALCIDHKDPNTTPTRVEFVAFDTIIASLRSRKPGVGI